MAGGIPFEVAERVWSYTYSTADTRSDVWEHQGTPLAGATAASNGPNRMDIWSKTASKRVVKHLFSH